MRESKKVSWNELVVFAKHAGNYIETKKGVETKFTYALRRVAAQIGPLDSKVNEVLASIEIDNCVTETRNGVDGVIARDDQGKLVYTVAGLKQCNKQKQDHLAGAHYEIDPYIARGELPADLTVDQVLAFSGLVIDADQLDAILAKLEDGTLDAASAASKAAAASQ